MGMLNLTGWKRYIPEGTRDLIFEDCSSRYEVTNRLREFYLGGGFREISSPSLEFFDVFSGDGGFIEQERMYKLFDNQGRIMVLRPDMTTPLARITATKLGDYTYPLRICYSGNIFRVNDIWEGKIGEITQSGVEIIGAKNIKADSEVIVTGISSLLSTGLRKFQIELGQAEFYKALVEELVLEEQQIDRLRDLIEKKNFSSIGAFIDQNEAAFGENAQVFKALPELFGGAEVLNRARCLTGNERALGAIDNIAQIYSRIEEAGYGKYVSVDLGLVQHIDYYTGIVFRGYSSELGNIILSGGRYDNLISRFGRDLSATGFAINIDNLMAALEREGKKVESPRKTLVFFNGSFMREAYSLVNMIRDRGVIGELSLFETEEESLEYGRKNGFISMISITGCDRVRVTGIESGCRRDMVLEELINSLGDQL